jgi:hypothetical protein
MFWKNDKKLKRLEIIFQSVWFYPAKPCFGSFPSPANPPRRTLCAAYRLRRIGFTGQHALKTLDFWGWGRARLLYCNVTGGTNVSDSCTPFAT